MLDMSEGDKTRPKKPAKVHIDQLCIHSDGFF